MSRIYYVLWDSLRLGSDLFLSTNGICLKSKTLFNVSEVLASQKKKIQKLNSDDEIQKGELQPEACLPHGGSAVLQNSQEQSLCGDGLRVLSRQRTFWKNAQFLNTCHQHYTAEQEEMEGVSC